MATDFNAKALLLKRTNEGWVEEEITIDSVNDILKIFKPFENDVSQVNINTFMKVYYCIKFLEDGIQAKVTDMNCETHYMVSPLLLVECDSSKPIDLTEETLKSMKDTILFY